MTPTIPTKIYEHLYRTALHLERQWSNVEMSEQFLPRQIEGAWNLFLRNGIDPTWSEEECATQAARLLRYVWKRNAIRDYKRQDRQRVAGTRVVETSLHEPGLDKDKALQVEHGSGQERDPWDNLLFHQLAKALLKRGFCEEPIWAFFWYVAGGEDWATIATLLEERLGVRAQPSTLRQWKVRHFPRIKAALRALLSDDGGAPGQPTPPVAPTKPSSPTARRSHASGKTRRAPHSDERVTRLR